MTRISKLTAALIATVTIGGAVISSTDQASAMMRGERMGMGRMHHGHGHFHRHGHGGFGRAMAVGAGLALVGAVIAANNSHVQIHRDAARQGWTKANQKRHDCHLVREWQDLVNAAERALARDRQMNKEYGEAVHSIKHVEFAQKELDRRLEELRKAKARCA
jgi:hypothetical protein